MKKKVKFTILFLLLMAFFSSIYLHYIPIKISSCIEIGSDSPEGLFLDGLYVYDGPNHEVGGSLPYRLDYIAPWSELPSILIHALNGDVCEYWSQKNETKH
ncbi:hypothetical protein OAP18_02060 [Gammaproteobacteria bacterium]|nr:hypothetical protein [Gammaproteobacteria bacterium]